MSIVCVTLHPAIDKVLRIDSLRPNQSVRAKIEMTYGGGKGNNVARTLTRMGVATIATGFQGGYSGEFISGTLAEEGIGIDYTICEQPTRTSLILHEVETQRTYAIYEPGQEVTADEAARLMAKLQSLLKPGDLCLLCGSGQTPVTAPLFAESIRIAREKDVRCVIDSSGDALARGIAEKPYMVKVNQSELSYYLARPLDTLEARVESLHSLHEQGIELVALTLGEEGMLATNGQETLKGELAMEKVINVVGCGDSMLAGMAKAMAADLPLTEIVRWGLACGAANTQVNGAGFIDRDLVQTLLPKVIIVKL